MSEAREGMVAGADARAAQDARSEASIPMLTEIIRGPGDAREPLPAALDHVQWAELAARVRDDVLSRLARHSDAILAAEMRASLALALERTLGQLGDELHDAMSRLVRDLVARAVDDEITRLHDEIARQAPPAGAGPD